MEGEYIPFVRKNGIFEMPGRVCEKGVKANTLAALESETKDMEVVVDDKKVAENENKANEIEIEKAKETANADETEANEGMLAKTPKVLSGPTAAERLWSNGPISELRRSWVDRSISGCVSGRCVC